MGGGGAGIRVILRETCGEGVKDSWKGAWSASEGLSRRSWVRDKLKLATWKQSKFVI